jgi:hypothetical protein
MWSCTFHSKQQQRQDTISDAVLCGNFIRISCKMCLAGIFPSVQSFESLSKEHESKAEKHLSIIIIYLLKILPVKSQKSSDYKQLFIFRVKAYYW